jgi:poly-gamma-glutamate capsule biosynthesis protein CapA/YwtB (metallophosphatase superfamily)
MAVGDVNLAWRVGDQIRSRGPQVPFAHVAGLLVGADVVLANLECTLSDRGEPWPDKQEHFAAPARAVEALELAGVTAVSMANNHSLDFGRESLIDGLALLDESGIEHVGAGPDRDSAREPLILDRNGVRIAILSYVLPFSSVDGRFSTRAWDARPDAAGVAVGGAEEAAPEIAAARRLADVLIVLVHSGGEFRRKPLDSQVAMAQAALDAGADMVIGAGPHNLQPYVRDQRTLVAYSLGNFVFDDYTGRQNDSVILDVTLSSRGVESVDWIPVQIDDGLPRPAVGDEIQRVLDELHESVEP